MRISSLDSYRSLDSDYAMMLESSEKIYAFPSAPNDVTFCFSAEQLVDVADLPLVLVDSRVDVAVPILRDYAKENRHVEYWTLRADTTNLRCIAADDDTTDLSIAGFRLTEDWIQLRIVRSTEFDRPCADWVAGLAAGAVPGKARDEDSPAVASEATLRGLLISRITPLAKPLKKHLPGSVVTLLYKTLEKIR